MRTMKANCENYIPPALQRDLRFEISKRKDKGASGLCIMIPLDDFWNMIKDINRQIGIPYVPVFLDVPIACWDKAGCAVMARPDQGQAAPVIFMLDGTEYDMSYLITPEEKVLTPDPPQPIATTIELPR